MAKFSGTQKSYTTLELYGKWNDMWILLGW